MTLHHPEMTVDVVWATLCGSQAADGESTQASPLRDALTQFFPHLRKLHVTNSDYLAQCALYFLKELYNQSPARSKKEQSSLEKPAEYLCQTTHATEHHLVILAEGENAWAVVD
jgi:hypothetical protein